MKALYYIIYAQISSENVNSLYPVIFRSQIIKRVCMKMLNVSKNWNECVRLFTVNNNWIDCVRLFTVKKEWIDCVRMLKKQNLHTMCTGVVLRCACVGMVYIHASHTWIKLFTHLLTHARSWKELFGFDKE